MKKRGISPLIATVGLIGISIVLFSIIFFWSRTFIKEQVMKFDEPIEEYCNELGWEVDAEKLDGDIKIFINNLGNVNIWKIKIDWISGGMKISEFYPARDPNNPDLALSAGQATQFNLQIPSSITQLEKIEIYPVLLGKGKKSGKDWEYPCINAKQEISL